MEGRVVCKVEDELVKRILMLVGVGDGEGKLILTDKNKDRGEVDFSNIIIPLYNPEEFINRRLHKHGKAD